MTLLNKSVPAPFIGLAALVLGVAVPLLFIQEAPRDALQAICGLGLILCGIALLLHRAAPQQGAAAPRLAAGGTIQILLGCSLLSSQWGVRLGLLAAGLLLLAVVLWGRVDRWFGASAYSQRSGGA